MRPEIALHAVGHQAKSIHAIALEALIATDKGNRKRLVAALQSIQDFADRISDISDAPQH